MCGISGYIDVKRGVSAPVLQEMTDIIRHRGPDDEGFALINGNQVQYAGGRDTMKELTYPGIEQCRENDTWYFGLGHRRLSILDLSVLGHQPMEKHNRILVFNGEIYNYLELRDELKKKGYQFASQCDTEVLLSAYDFWGKDCVEHFNGMWAFALYDCETKELFLSRDRFGVKPLYYYSDGEKFLFGSEIKQILCDPEVPRAVNEEIMAHYLRYGFREYSSETFFEGIYALVGGCSATITFDFNEKKLKNISIKRYYDLNKVQEKKVADPVGGVGGELRRAINLRLRSDVKVGSCLSGGLDSSSIVGIICDELRKKNEDVKSFSTVTSKFDQDRDIDETNFSKQVVQYCGCEENFVQPDGKSMFENLNKIVWHQEEPLAHLGLEVSYAVFKKASECGCKVFFDGQGGDEGLTGYYFYYANYLWNVLKKKGVRTFRSEMKKVVASSGLSTKEAWKFLLYFNLSGLRKTVISFRRDRYLDKNVIKKVNFKNIQIFFESKGGLERQLEDFLYGSLPYILHIEDRNSMASSVETRLPFLDYRYVEKVLSVSVSEKIRDGYTKVPLRDYMENLLPDEVIWRKNKMGFPAPHRKWLLQMPEEYVKELLEHPVSGYFFNMKEIEKAYINKKRNLEMVEKFIAVELWMRTFQMRVEK